QQLFRIGRLNDPAARSPVSTDRSLNTTRWVMVSTLCHTIIWPAGRLAGFGENDSAPFTPTTLTVTVPGVLGGGVEATGFPLPYPLPPPQPHRLNPNAITAPAVTNARIAVSFLTAFFVGPRSSARAAEHFVF